MVHQDFFFNYENDGKPLEDFITLVLILDLCSHRSLNVGLNLDSRG